ncbi:hypothetical protein [Peterkaempfera sp. SMS 1(5)a]|uniref:hypothetical protein n=1 Tax=Peterkaempfera podocarpi TaxID=3232308 RepID=UPI00367156BB
MRTAIPVVCCWSDVMSGAASPPVSNEIAKSVVWHRAVPAGADEDDAFGNALFPLAVVPASTLPVVPADEPDELDAGESDAGDAGAEDAESDAGDAGAEDAESADDPQALSRRADAATVTAARTVERRRLDSMVKFPPGSGLLRGDLCGTPPSCRPSFTIR